jgi:hypothetical protein
LQPPFIWSCLASLSSEQNAERKKKCGQHTKKERNVKFMPFDLSMFRALCLYNAHLLYTCVCTFLFLKKKGKRKRGDSKTSRKMERVSVDLIPKQTHFDFSFLFFTARHENNF